MLRWITMWAAATLVGAGALKAEPTGSPIMGPQAPGDDVASLLRTLVGSYQGDGRTLHIAEVNLEGFGYSVYVELVRDSQELRPLSQQFWEIRRRQGQMLLRMYEMPSWGPSRDTLIGLWARAGLLPSDGVSKLHAVGDMSVEIKDSAAHLWTAHALPVDFDGAIEVSYDIRFNADSAEWKATGFDGEGEAIWGQSPTSMERFDTSAQTEVRQDGLVVIDLQPGEGAEVIKHDTVATHWRAFLFNGGQIFDTKTPDGRSGMALPFIRALPAQGMTRGWNEGLLGMKAHGVRRIVVPPWLAYGEKGLEGRIPPNAWLIFDITLLSIRDE